MTTLNVFKSTLPSVNYIFSNGKPAIFVNGVYRTDIQAEIEALKYEIAQKHPHIYVDPTEETIESDMVDPMNALRAKIIAEYKASMAQATDPSRDMGSSEHGKLMPGNSSDIAEATVGSGNSTTNSAKLVSLAATLAK